MVMELNIAPIDIQRDRFRLFSLITLGHRTGPRNRPSCLIPSIQMRRQIERYMEIQYTAR